MKRPEQAETVCWTVSQSGGLTLCMLLQRFESKLNPLVKGFGRVEELEQRCSVRPLE